MTGRKSASRPGCCDALPECHDLPLKKSGTLYKARARLGHTFKHFGYGHYHLSFEQSGWRIGPALGFTR